ncbi:MAG: DUF3369 domain-containing protein [Magnetococcales bacterium]|nr:DUF3369 domain-containing protein [Magnetococcales bacterium]
MSGSRLEPLQDVVLEEKITSSAKSNRFLDFLDIPANLLEIFATLCHKDILGERYRYGIDVGMTPDMLASDLFFAEESCKGTGGLDLACVSHVEQPWKVLVVDDDEEIHSLTRLVLRDFSFANKKIELISGYSAEDAKALMQQHPDVAVILLDVVMESDEAGLHAVRHIRNVLQNHLVRIILRTGQPGQAPEQQVIQEYDINDYKDKVRLTTQRLITSITTALRSYRDLRTIDNTRRGLAAIVHGTGDLFEARSLGRLANSILRQVQTLVHGGEDKPQGGASALFAIREYTDYEVYAAVGSFEGHIGKILDRVLPEKTMADLQKNTSLKEEFFGHSDFLAKYVSRGNLENVFYLDAGRPLEDLDRDLLKTFSANIAFAFENLGLNREIVNTQKDVTFTLGEVIEVRSNEAGHHVRRVAESSRLLGMLAGLDAEDVELLWLSSPMHDLGKIGIPDSILKKPGKLDPDEWKIMQTHTTIGRQILNNSQRPILQTGAIIAYQHHEKWDGTGYPEQLRGENIHVFARITGLIDVFDALYHERCYKKAWPLEKIVELLQQERGSHFAPQLVDLFLGHLDEFLEIQDALKG